MPWKKSDDIVTKRFTQHGLGPALAAGQVCQQAEKLYPELFQAVSLKNGILHLRVRKADQLGLKLIEGTLLADLQAFASERNLPSPRRLRLTFQDDSGSI